MWKYVLLHDDEPSSRYTRNDGIGDTLICTNKKRRQKKMTFSVWLQFINWCEETPVFLRKIAY